MTNVFKTGSVRFPLYQINFAILSPRDGEINFVSFRTCDHLDLERQLGFDPSDFFQIWNICLYPSWQVNYTVNIPCGYPIIRYRVFQFRWSWGWSVVKVCNGFCFFLFNIFLIFLKRIWLTCSIFFFQRISDPVQSLFQMVYCKLNSREIFLLCSQFWKELLTKHNCDPMIGFPSRQRKTIAVNTFWHGNQCNTQHSCSFRTHLKLFQFTSVF